MSRFKHTAVIAPPPPDRIGLACFFDYLKKFLYAVKKQLFFDARFFIKRTCIIWKKCYNSDMYHHGSAGGFMYKKSFAFTLAEVLITLGIIGVVAALTMPSLIQNHRKHVVETQLKKFYSMMNQAIMSVNAEYGGIENWYPNYLVDVYQIFENGEWVTINRPELVDAAFEKYIAKYLKITDTKKTEYGNKVYYLSDGSALRMGPATNQDFVFYTQDYEKCLKKENPTGSCEFYFTFRPTSDWMNRFAHSKNKLFEPYIYNWDGQKSSLYNNDTNGCNNGGVYCTKLIQYNGWKIPDDYPKKYKF